MTLKTYDVEIDQKATEIYRVRAHTVAEAKRIALKRHRRFPAKWFNFYVDEVE